MPIRILIIIFVCCIAQATLAQMPGGNIMNRFGNMGSSGGKTDSIKFERRDDAKDSISITYRLLDSIRNVKLDTNVNDFYRYYAVPFALQHLGNPGLAGYSLVYQANNKPGFDAGFHAFDAYRLTLEQIRFFKTTKPFTQLSYQLASGKEQMIKILHTQNPRPNLNFGFEYRLLNAPGFLVTQNTNHNNYSLFSQYQGPKKRYAAWFVLLNNSINSSENGGIQSDTFLANPDFARRFSIPVNLGKAPLNPPNPFATSVNTGNKYREFTFFYRHSYDVGKKDSLIINDSTTEYLFYPRLRFQHTFSYSSNRYQFEDEDADSARYKNWYDTTLGINDTFLLADRWKIVHNDFSIIQFPDSRNTGQFLQVGARLENISGRFNRSAASFYNIVAHGEYRNKTRNKKWDINLKGEFYLNGLNSGDYAIQGILNRYLNKRWGNIMLYFSNVNRSPSFVFNRQSSFYINHGSSSNNLNKENIITIKATAENPFITLSATNYFIVNHTYFNSLYKSTQFSRAINLLQLTAIKKIKLFRKWNWHIEAHVQLTDNAAPIKVPLAFARNRIAYENQLFKNLYLSTGMEMRYFTPYKGYNYSPALGQFAVQDSFTITNRPDIAAFAHFRIRSFVGYLRAENLNSVSFQNGFGFTQNNFGAPLYIYPGFVFRFGISWNFVN